jgi:hypothetical protein
MRVLAHLLPSLAGRAAAVAAALLLTGAPRLLDAAAPLPVHRCQCGEHGAGHRCTCVLCALAARRAAAGKAPPCHRIALRTAAEELSGGSPCMTGCCSGPEERRAASGDPDPLVLPGIRLLPAPPGPRDRAEPRLARGETARRPELPPPRLG